MSSDMAVEEGVRVLVEKRVAAAVGAAGARIGGLLWGLCGWV